MARPEHDLIPCPVCAGTPTEHGRHDWRLDQWSRTQPVVSRCRICNGTIPRFTRQEFRSAARAGGVFMWRVSEQESQHGVPVTPCDVCGGRGVIDRCVLSSGDASEMTCPTCGKSDRSIVIDYVADPDEDLLLRGRAGEVIVAGFPPPPDAPAFYCGRCDHGFGHHVEPSAGTHPKDPHQPAAGDGHGGRP